MKVLIYPKTHLCLCAGNEILQLDYLVIDAQTVALLNCIVRGSLLSLALHLGGGA